MMRLLRSPASSWPSHSSTIPSKKAVDSLGPVAELPPIVWLLVVAILLIIGVFTLRDALARCSRLLRPEALQLKADNPAHLKGRSGDIERLSTSAIPVNK